MIDETGEGRQQASGTTASVTDCSEALSPVRTGRSSVDTMPSVTVLDSPSGAPTARTG